MADAAWENNLRTSNSGSILDKDNTMRAEPYWIEGPWPGRLAILPRPRGGEWLEDEVRLWQQAGLDVIVSLLTSDEVAELGLAEEARLCQTYGLQFLSFPIVDRSVPSSRRATLDFIRRLKAALADGKSLAIQCRQGIGRSALIAACLLVLSGVDPETALQHVSAARGCPVPETSEQRQWVIGFARVVVTSLIALRWVAMVKPLNDLELSGDEAVWEVVRELGWSNDREALLDEVMRLTPELDSRLVRLVREEFKGLLRAQLGFEYLEQ